MEQAKAYDLLSLLPEELEALMLALGEPKYRAAQLFGNGQSYAVYLDFLRMRASEPLCRVIRQHIHRNTAGHCPLALGICLGIQMIFADCSEFQSFSPASIIKQNPDKTRRVIIGIWYCHFRDI